jgi:hypothetical protein
MFRKTLLIAISAIALMSTLGTGNTASQAFAKGGNGMGKGNPKGSMSKDHRGRDWRFHRFDRYRWGYGFGYNCVEPVVEVPVAPVCTTCEAVPAAPAVPTCTACEPVVVPEYFPFWGYGKYGKFHDYRHHRERPLSHGSRGGRK